MKILAILLLIAFNAACSLLDSNRSQNTQKVETREVPFQAREADAGLRKRILVLPFLDEKPQRSVKATEAARQAVIREIGLTRGFVVLNNSDFPHDPGKFMNEDRDYDLEKIAQLSNTMGISAVVEGKILEVKAKRLADQVGLFRSVKARVEATVRIRVYSSKNGREILNDVRSATIESETTRVGENSGSDRFLEDDPNLLREAVSKAFRGSMRLMVGAIDKLSWEGRVALISGERVFVNAGRLSGLQVGDILKVMEEGEEVYDPDSGVFIGRAPGRMKGTVEVVSYFGKDGAITIVHSGSGFRENDLVEVY